MRVRPVPGLRASSIVDSRGKPYVMATGPAYDSAGSGRRYAGLASTNADVNTTLTPELAHARDRSHALVRSNPWAWAGRESFLANAIGTGIKPRPKSSDEAFNRDAIDLFHDWVPDADADGRLDFYGLQALALGAIMDGGEVVIRYRNRELSDGLAVPFQLQVLEGAHLPERLTGRNPRNGREVKSGIEFGPLGDRTAYFLHRTHPGDKSAMTFPDMGSLAEVPASEVMHVFRPTRPGQLRGEPWLTRVLLRLDDIDNSDDAELVRKRATAMFGGFIHTTDPDSVPPSFGDAGDPNAEGQVPVALEPGTFPTLKPGQDVAFAQPPDVGPNWSSFNTHHLRAAAAGGYGNTYEQMTGDLTEVNYSSMRGGAIEFRRRCEAFVRHILVHQFLRPVWRYFVREAVAAGELTAPGFVNRRRRRDYTRVVFLQQAVAWVDPEKETNAAVKAARAGFKSVGATIIEHGNDPEAVADELQDDYARNDDRGLRLDTDGRHFDGAGKPIAAPADTDDNAAPGEEEPDAPLRAVPGGRA